jgi:hypothetical protein
VRRCDFGGYREAYLHEYAPLLQRRRVPQSPSEPAIQAGSIQLPSIQVMPPKTVAERQEALRKRRADDGLTEVRGVYAHPANHAKIKTFAKDLQPSRKHAKKIDVTRNDV